MHTSATLLADLYSRSASYGRQQSFALVTIRLGADNDVVDRNVDELDEESDKAHYAEADRGGNGNLLKLASVRLRAALHQTNGVLGEQAAGLAELDNLIHG